MKHEEKITRLAIVSNPVLLYQPVIKISIKYKLFFLQKLFLHVILQVQAFEEEMTRKNADWQVYTYGNHTYHAFTVPTANQPPQAQYQPVSAKRSWIAMKNFLFEIFNM